MQDINWVVGNNTDVNAAYDNFNNKFIQTANKHAPFKERKILPKQIPYMNKTLKSAVYKKKMLYNKFQKMNTKKNWEAYRRQRNLVTKLKKQSVNNYFIERCTGGPKSKDFWPTVKPFLTNKGCTNQKDTILQENKAIVTDQQEISEIFNDFFVNVAKNIGDNCTDIDDKHPSIVAIKHEYSDRTVSNKLNFQPVDETFVAKRISKINVKKATGIDGISPKLLHYAKPVISKPISDLVNLSLSTSIFPDSLKIAQVAPIHKKNSVLEKGNYRPVSVLPAISKIYETAIEKQLSEHFENIFNQFLAAFRSGYGCQSTLLRVLEDWKKALDSDKYLAAILMDLSKAFDCLPHDLLLLKLENYGLSKSAVNLLKSYLSDRKQCVKIGQSVSQMLDIYKGVPQGSILGPVLFNVFINDIFLFVNSCDLYNYADDNTLSKSGNSLATAIKSLEEDSGALISWFSSNKMQANPEKFQAIAIGNKTHKQNIVFNLNGNSIKCDDEVKLLGVTIDFKLDFNTHISNICKKAARQLNVLKRIGTHLNRLAKLTIYHSFIMSNLSFCPLTWHFCSEKNTNKIEKLQERALRFIYDDYTNSYNHLLEQSKLPSLKIRRMRTMALETYKIVNKSSPEFLHNIITIKDSSYNFRYKNTVVIPQPRTTRYGKKSFSYEAARLWNSLPNEARNLSTFGQFENFISTWCFSENCTCSSCRQ